ncbi:MAG: type II secretion system protein [Patescibacteria group bacterium]
MSRISQSKGFTLVELLVVMSIMTFLASIVITSVGAARAKGADSTIKQAMNNMRGQASLIYNDTGSFSGVCNNSDPTLASAISQVNTLSGATGQCNAVSTEWAFASALKGGGYWCVDSTNVGRSKNALGVSYTAVIPPDTGTTQAPALASVTATACN